MVNDVINAVKDFYDFRSVYESVKKNKTMQKDKILEQESANSNSNEIHLYQEGMFWKAYEYSAYRFTFGICAFMVKKKFIRTLSRDMVSIGFPMDSLKKHSALFDLVSEGDKQCTIIPKSCTPPMPFEEWRASIPLIESKTATPSKNVVVASSVPQYQCKSEAEKIVDEIRRYNLANATPMECMMWLSQLKTRINNG